MVAIMTADIARGGGKYAELTFAAAVRVIII